MKQLTFTLILCLAGFWSFSQNKDLARVYRVQGIVVYVMAEPLRDYNVMCDVSTGIKAESALTGGLFNESIADKMGQFVNRALKENPRIDAVVYSSGKRVVGVQFKDAATADTKGIARVDKVNGLPVFVMSEPLADYETLDSKGAGIKWKSVATGGILNNSIEDDVDRFVKRVDNSNMVDAVICDGGKRATAIHFKN